MRVPKTVRVNAIDYSVVETKNLNDGMTMYKGLISYDTSKIEISPDISNQEKCRTLLHEITHAILKDGRRYDDNKNEELVETIAQGMYQVIVDNPKMFHVEQLKKK